MFILYLKKVYETEKIASLLLLETRPHITNAGSICYMQLAEDDFEHLTLPLCLPSASHRPPNLVLLITRKMPNGMWG